jgi:hypothetical protein
MLLRQYAERRCRQKAVGRKARRVEPWGVS